MEKRDSDLLCDISSLHPRVPAALLVRAWCVDRPLLKQRTPQTRDETYLEKVHTHSVGSKIKMFITKFHLRNALETSVCSLSLMYKTVQIKKKR